MIPPRDALLADLHARLAAASERARRLAAGLPDDVIRAAPPGGGWSIGQVMEHVLAVDADYMQEMRRVMSAAPRPVGAPRPWRPTLVGRLLAWALAPKNRMKAPTAPRYDGLTPRAAVVEAFVQHLGELSTLAREADGLELGRLRTISPINGAIRMNLGDAFNVLVVHVERHLGQIERTRSAIGR